MLTPSKIVCVGRNYVAHAAELGNEVPDEPLIFLKPPSSLIEGGRAIEIPAGVGRVDYEGEIGLVMGRRARDVTEQEALDYVESLVAANDVTARDLQRKDDQWSRAKGFDTFCPVSVPEPIAGVDVDQLEVVTRVNGDERQRGRVSDMAFGPAFLVSYISSIMTLEPGDLILTGTPEGIGPLRDGDEVEVEIVGFAHVVSPVRSRAAAE